MKRPISKSIFHPGLRIQDDRLLVCVDNSQSWRLRIILPSLCNQMWAPVCQLQSTVHQEETLSLHSAQWPFCAARINIHLVLQIVFRYELSILHLELKMCQCHSLSRCLQFHCNYDFQSLGKKEKNPPAANAIFLTILVFNISLTELPGMWCTARVHNVVLCNTAGLGRCSKGTCQWVFILH